MLEQYHVSFTILFCCIHTRSSVDDYTPQDQVDIIQREVLSVLEELYKELEVKCLYKLQE